MTKTASIATWSWVAVIFAGLTLVYGPLWIWLARTSVQITQLTNGAILILLALVAGIRDARRSDRPQPSFNAIGVGFLWSAIGLLMLTRYWPHAVLALTMMSFCLAFAAAMTFLFGVSGIRHFVPALAGFLVFGILIGLFPRLDWPLRALAAEHAGSLLATLGMPVRLLIEPGRPAELVLDVGNRLYRVATECNGFGLLTSSLLLATILAFHYRLPWLNKLGLLAISVPIAVVANFMRIASICLVAPRVPFSYHLVHEALGTLLYLSGLAMVWWLAYRAAENPENSEPRDRTMS